MVEVLVFLAGACEVLWKFSAQVHISLIQQYSGVPTGMSWMLLFEDIMTSEDCSYLKKTGFLVSVCLLGTQAGSGLVAST